MTGPGLPPRCCCGVSRRWVHLGWERGDPWECPSGEPPQTPTHGLLPSQLLNQVLNRVTAERNLFDRVVTLRLPGEDLALHTHRIPGLGSSAGSGNA